VIKQVAEEMRQEPDFKMKILEPIEIFGVDQFADSAVIIKARFKTKPIEQWVVGREYRRRLKKAFDEQGIEIPFPHRTVYWGEEIKPLQVQTGDK
jgi:small conductance mechanosensitive channel